jgi:HlyD family secretion protein
MPVTDLLKAKEIPEFEANPPLPAAEPLTAPPPKSRRRWWIAAAAVVVLAAFTYFLFRGSSAPQYITATVDRGTIESSVTATGTLNAVKTVQVGSQVSGNIVALYADFNTHVKQGQLVAKIDPAIFQARVDQAKANLESAKAAVATATANVAKADSDIASAQANLATQKANVVRAQSAVNDAKLKNERRVELLKQGIIAKEEADTAQSTYEQAVADLEAAKAAVNAAESQVQAAKSARQVAQTQMEQAQAAVNQVAATLKQAALDLEHTNIYAPVDGVVISRNMDVGQTVAASFQAPTIFQIAQDLTKMQVDTNVDESDVAPIRVGQQANFTVDAFPGTIFHGTVVQIRQAPINVQNVVTYDVVVAVANNDLKLFPGMTASVKIVTGTAENALRIPAAALRFRPASAVAGSRANQPQPLHPRGGAAGQTVYVLENGQPKPVEVQLGLADGNYVQVVGGLSEGQKVITGTAAKPQKQAAPRAPRIGF